MRIKTLIAGACGLAVVPLTGVGTADAATAASTLQLPFPCGETWVGSSKSRAHTAGYEIDFNGSATDGNADLGRTVVAAGAGTVIMSEYRRTDGFGNVIKIRHSDGTVTLYAHLNARSVAKGATVRQGQKIGTVGRSSAKYKDIIAHLHYEQRTSSGSIVPAKFNGTTYRYPNQTLTSRNCGGGGTQTQTGNGSGNNNSGGSGNPYSATQICGSGFKQIDSQNLGSAGKVVLLYSAATGQNCVTTLRNSGSGKAAVQAYLEVQGKARKTDSGSYQYYAGPVKDTARKTCVKWGGAIGSAKYDSPLEHCD